jgi:hypothetical protein
MTHDVEQNALEYLRRGWSVIPIRPHDKRPAIRWMEYQHRLATEDEIREWYRHWPNANVGIVTGAISGLVVLDVDPKHDGDASLEGLIREHGPLPHTIEAETGGGGRHLYFSHPGGMVRNKVGLASGIDLRGDGGCVVAPPSIHASGKVYSWLPGHEPHKTTPAPLPNWLLMVMTGSSQRLGHPLEYWRQLVKEGVPEGERNNTIASFAGHLLWHGVDPDVVQELLLCWNRVRCRPPLSDEEVIRTVDSISHMHNQHDRM